MFSNNPSFQAAAVLSVFLVAYTLHVQYMPFLSALRVEPLTECGAGSEGEGGSSAACGGGSAGGGRACSPARASTIIRAPSDSSRS